MSGGYIVYIGNRRENGDRYVGFRVEGYQFNPHVGEPNGKHGKKRWGYMGLSRDIFSTNTMALDFSYHSLDPKP